jgi:hypothetical protein
MDGSGQGRCKQCRSDELEGDTPQRFGIHEYEYIVRCTRPDGMTDMRS